MFVQMYRMETVSRQCVFDWFKCFRDGKETSDEPCLGWPLTRRTPDLTVLVQDRRLTLPLMAEELVINKDMVHTIVCKDLDKLWNMELLKVVQMPPV